MIFKVSGIASYWRAMHLRYGTVAHRQIIYLSLRQVIVTRFAITARTNLHATLLSLAVLTVGEISFGLLSHGVETVLFYTGILNDQTSTVDVAILETFHRGFRFLLAGEINEGKTTMRLVVKLGG